MANFSKRYRVLVQMLPEEQREEWMNLLRDLDEAASYTTPVKQDAAPSAEDIPDGRSQLYDIGGTLTLYYNDGGTLRSN